MGQKYNSWLSLEISEYTLIQVFFFGFFLQTDSKIFPVLIGSMAQNTLTYLAFKVEIMLLLLFFVFLKSTQRNVIFIETWLLKNIGCKDVSKINQKILSVIYCEFSKIWRSNYWSACKKEKKSFRFSSKSACFPAKSPSVIRVQNINPCCKNCQHVELCTCGLSIRLFCPYFMFNSSPFVYLSRTPTLASKPWAMNPQPLSWRLKRGRSWASGSLIQPPFPA